MLSAVPYPGSERGAADQAGASSPPTSAEGAFTERTKELSLTERMLVLDQSEKPREATSHATAGKGRCNEHMFVNHLSH